MTTIENIPEAGTDPDARIAADLSRRLAAAFLEAGEELYLVGGAVRDQLLGVVSTNLDYASSALPDVSVRILDAFGTDNVYQTGARFGTIGARLGVYEIEVTTYRSGETYPPGSRKPLVRFGTTLMDDLWRRDFTINAIAFDPLTDRLIDPLDGREDLAAHIIRAVGEAANRFQEDPLRLLRAIRFGARLGFCIEPRTWSSMVRMAQQLEAISRERIRDEYSEMLEGVNPTGALTLLRDSNLLENSAPQLFALTRMSDHGPRHPLSLWDHTMRVVAAVPPRLVLRWAAVLHDIAKPATRTIEANGRIRFFHHEEAGAAIARDLLRSLRYPRETVDAIALLVETHMQVHAYSEEWSDGAVRRLILRLGPWLQDAIQLARADAAGHGVNAPAVNAPKFDALVARIQHLEQEPAESLASPLSGVDLMARYQRPPGPWIGRVKDALAEQVIEGSLAPGDREGAWKFADSIVATTDS